MPLGQDLQGIVFFETSACLTLLILLLELRKGNDPAFYRLWLAGWVALTVSSCAQLALFFISQSALQLLSAGTLAAAFVLFLSSLVQFTTGADRKFWPWLSLTVVAALTAAYYQAQVTTRGGASWHVSILLSALGLASGWLVWRAAAARAGHGAKLLAGTFFLLSLNLLDQPEWSRESLFVFRFAFHNFLLVGLGVGMIVMLMEGARSRTEELNRKMQQFTMLTASSSQQMPLPELLHSVLGEVCASLGVANGLIRLKQPGTETFTIVAASGYSDAFLKQYARISLADPLLNSLQTVEYRVHRFEDEKDPKVRHRMVEAGITQLVGVGLRGKETFLGSLVLGSRKGRTFRQDELSYLVNIASFLGTTVENVTLLEQLREVQQQWAYSFDSIGDPIMVHDTEGRIVRANRRLEQLLQREGQSLLGRPITDLLPVRSASYKVCPYCEGAAGDGDFVDPWLQGYFLASNSTVSDSAGKPHGVIHVLKDITERKRAEEKYSALVASVQEGVFITTPAGRFLDFNNALMRIVGYTDRDALMRVDIPSVLYVNPKERERLKKLLQDHGSVGDFEFELRRRDGEVRTVSESCTAIRDSAGNITAYQGFLLDVTERHQAELEIRRRNRELQVLNSISQTLMSSLDIGDSIHRTLRQIIELFELDTAGLYLLDQERGSVRRVASVGFRSEFQRSMPEVAIPTELVQQLAAMRAPYLSASGLPLPAIAREVIKKEGLASTYLVTLWSKDRLVGALSIGSRTVREFAPADVSLLIAVGSQIASAVERSMLFEESRAAYENLRRTQEQLLHSEKMAAVGQLISGVAHELNNPLTAILGYSQLLSSSEQVGPRALEYSEKLYKQAQRTHRIVQNLLSFARQHKPERSLVRIERLLEETLALRDYDLRLNDIHVHLEIPNSLPATSADAHQLQQVFLNLINNAADAILERAPQGDLWVKMGVAGEILFVEFTDSGSGVRDASRVFDPFYTTKPVGKGTGLGLSICYGIVTEHGGTIRVENRPPNGACFRVELPVQSSPAAVDEVARISPVNSRRGRILILDADESVLEALSVTLREAAHEVDSARSIEGARALIREKEFDLLLVDLHFRQNGSPVNAQQWLATLGLPSSQAVLWMSADAPDAQGSLAAAERVLQKPFRAVDLVASVQEALSAVQPAGFRA